MWLHDTTRSFFCNVSLNADMKTNLCSLGVSATLHVITQAFYNGATKSRNRCAQIQNNIVFIIPASCGKVRRHFNNVKFGLQLAKDYTLFWSGENIRARSYSDGSMSCLWNNNYVWLPQDFFVSDDYNRTITFWELRILQQRSLTKSIFEKTYFICPFNYATANFTKF